MHSFLQCFIWLLYGQISRQYKLLYEFAIHFSVLFPLVGLQTPTMLNLPDIACKFEPSLYL
jgi:hypothetical protein